MYPSPDDLNRSPASPRTAPDVLPRSLKWSYYLSVAAAIVMVVSGLVLLTGTYPAGSPASQEVIDAFLSNVRFMGVFNIVAGLVIAALVAQLKSGSVISRRVLVGVIVVTIFSNVVAFAIQVGGIAMIVIVVLLAVAALLMFRPDASRYIVHMSGRSN
ncbi:hypothetical protein C5L39_06615 [Corynebacterium alimapuense]|uniref:Tellurium resistance protein TerC n=2 Tax=Corynebacterium alimapuense TaxID=1576874 RepID=A0A3M8K8U2_9CORY|nr:hypothetical protein C5L39_06615 [Corynebacterium alimapuense]